MNTGKQFEEETRNSILAYQGRISVFFWRVMDYKEYNLAPICRECRTKVVSYCPRCNIPYHSLISAPKSPADFLMVIRGRTIFLECKSSTDDISFRLRHGREETPTMKSHQVEMGLEIIMAGGEYYFLINKRVPRRNEVWMFDAIGWDHIQKDMESVDRKSIKWAELDEYVNLGIGRKVAIKKGKLFDFDFLFE